MSIATIVALSYLTFGVWSAESLIYAIKVDRETIEESARKNGIEDHMDFVLNVLAVIVCLFWPFFLHMTIPTTKRRVRALGKKNTP